VEVVSYPQKLSKLFSTFNKRFEFQPKRTEKHNKNSKRYDMRQRKGQITEDIFYRKI
jgi:hypothetical protein